MMRSTPSLPAGLRVGIGMHSYGEQWNAAKTSARDAKFSNPLGFLRYAGEIGAAGVQVGIGVRDAASAKALRDLSEAKGLYLEGQISLPRDEAGWAQVEEEIRSAADAGATLLRIALLGGRRYETFRAAGPFREFMNRSRAALERVEPLLRRSGLRLAVENHKDLLVPELSDVLRRLSSEFVGVCVDTGNSLALLEDPMAVVEAYAPFALSVHLKDMAVAEAPDGFLLSEVPFGAGMIDLQAVVRTLLRAKPGLCFSVEMITRDPLRIPCLTDTYWAALGDVRASDLARTLALVRRRSNPALPRVSHRTPEERLKIEDDNVRACLTYAKENLTP